MEQKVVVVVGSFLSINDEAAKAVKKLNEEGWIVKNTSSNITRVRGENFHLASLVLLAEQSS